MKIAVTGSNGMLGSDIIRSFSGLDVIPLTRKDFDITDLNQSVSSVKAIKPDLLIHAAAYADVDGSELDPDKAFYVNGIGSRNMAIACEEAGSRVMYISSDYVFDGCKKEPYDEWDTPNPINKYGSSKLLGEQYVMSLTNRFYVVRTSWLYGKNGKNFVDTICRLISERDEIEVVDDQFGSPTYTVDLAKTLRDLIGKGYGIYHITNSSHCSWFEFAVEIAALHSDKVNIKPTSSQKFDRSARRPVYSVLKNNMLHFEGIAEPRSWKEALNSYINRSEV